MAFVLQTDAFIEREQLALRCGLPSFHLAHARQGLETEFVPLTEQRYRLLAQSQRLGGVVPQRIQIDQTGVGRSHGGGQDQPGLRDFNLGRALLRDGRRQRRAVLAPEVQFPAQIQRRETVIVPSMRQRLRRDQVVVALPALVEQDIAGDLGHPCRTGELRGSQWQPPVSLARDRGQATRAMPPRSVRRVAGPDRRATIHRPARPPPGRRKTVRSRAVQPL